MPLTVVEDVNVPNCLRGVRLDTVSCLGLSIETGIDMLVMLVPGFITLMNNATLKDKLYKQPATPYYFSG